MTFSVKILQVFKRKLKRNHIIFNISSALISLAQFLRSLQILFPKSKTVSVAFAKTSNLTPLKINISKTQNCFTNFRIIIFKSK